MASSLSSSSSSSACTAGDEEHRLEVKMNSIPNERFDLLKFKVITWNTSGVKEELLRWGR